MPKITIGEQTVDAFVEFGEDIDAIVDEIRQSLDAKDFPTDNAINEDQRCGYSERRDYFCARCFGTTGRRV
jgi:hypothetical protein